MNVGGTETARRADTPLRGARQPSPRRVEFESVPGLILLRLVESPGRRPRRPRLGDLGRQAEVAQDVLHDDLLRDDRRKLGRLVVKKRGESIEVGEGIVRPFEIY